MQLTVIPMQAAHIGFVVKILNSPHNKTMLHPGDHSLADWEKAFIKNLSDPDEQNFIVTANEPAAWIKLNGLQSKQAWLSMLVVSEEHQRQGVGSFAVKYAERFARRKGFTSLGIHTNADNTIARRCYEKLGYTLTEESECTNGDGQTRMGCTYMSIALSPT
jgi:ribosomal protein S18 acetylase RimI-like enzyme